jgi:CRP-like cAMP-binding protein
VTPDEKRKHLSGHAFFRDLDATLVVEVASRAVAKRLADGARLFAKGDPPDGLYGVIAGAVRVSSASADGKEMLVTVLDPGQWFGEISLFDGLPRTHDAHAKGETTLLLLPRRDFQDLLERRPALYPHFTRQLCARLRRVFAALEDAAFLDVASHLARRLLEMSQVPSVATAESDGATAVRLPQEELARLLGATRESVGKVLKSWERQGLVELAYGRVVIRDRDGLAAMVEAALGAAG